MRKNTYEKNIKVTFNATNSFGEVVRTSTTLNYGICDYYFGYILYPEEAKKARNDKRYKDSRKRYRQWLEGVVIEWVKQQKARSSNLLEQYLLEEIYKSGYNSAIEQNKNSMGLKLD